MTTKNPLLDNEFLYELNQFQHKEIYAKIVVLNFDELPLEQIEGRITSGSINIDGNSAVRRSCNLSLVAKDVNINDFYWSIGSKFTLEVGVNNEINDNYPEIIWFKQGIYVISSFNSSLTGNNYSISIGGKDKMCLLNGDIGGSLPASIDFGKIDTYNTQYSEVSFEDFSQYEANKYYIKNENYIESDKNSKEYIISADTYNSNQTYYSQEITLTQEDLTLEMIIREAVHAYGKELYSNIIINDLTDYGLELMEYRGDESLYLLYNEAASIYDQMIIEGNAELIKVDTVETIKDSDGNYTIVKILEKDVKISELENYNTAIDEFNEYRTHFIFQDDSAENLEDKKLYSATKVEYGDATGYRTTDLTYAGDLISSIGESLTSILDKIKNMLGAFEYFYDLDGRFVFQAKKIYSQTSWNTLQDVDGQTYSRDAVDESPYSYSFEDVNLVQKFSNTPTLNNLKNDYSVWGVRKTIDGTEIPIHSRYAIHKKPSYYKAYNGKIYCSDLSIFEEVKQAEKDKIVDDLNNRVQNFTPKYLANMPLELDAPWRNADGSWTPGWWDIRDWHDYYVALRQEEPNFTMKWYSRNDSSGCQRLLDIYPPDKYNYFDERYYGDSYVWLIIYYPEGGKPNIQHGSGNPAHTGWLCTKYESYYNEKGTLITKRCDPLEQKNFIPPYCYCSDNHTYLEFLEGDIKEQGNSVYFYNPNFPGVSSFEEAVQDQVDKEYQEMIDKGMINLVDWREIIYRMALDYYAHNQDVDFSYQISQNNLIYDGSGSYYPNGMTGYEMFYTDIQGFWRQLYNPEPDPQYETSGGYYKTETFYEVIYNNDKEEYEFYQLNKKNEINEFELVEKPIVGNKYYTNNILATDLRTYLIGIRWVPFEQIEVENDYFLKGQSNEYWNKIVVEAPELLNFWIDFYDIESEIGQYSISVIGDRPKVVNNNKISSIYFRNVPQVIFSNAENQVRKTGYTYINLPFGMEDLFSISSQGKSAEEETNELFNKHSYFNEGISITTIPIYNLDANTLIYIHNEENNINGKYQISKISIPLTYNGMMQISASKIIDPII